MLFLFFCYQTLIFFKLVSKILIVTRLGRCKDQNVGIYFHAVNNASNELVYLDIFRLGYIL